MRIKIRGGTASNGEPSLPHLPVRYCRRGSQPARRNHRVQPAVLRAQPDHVSSHHVHGYSDRRQPSLRAMEEIAWVSGPIRRRMRSDS